MQAFNPLIISRLRLSRAEWILAPDRKYVARLERLVVKEGIVRPQVIHGRIEGMGHAVKRLALPYLVLHRRARMRRAGDVLDARIRRRH